VRPWSNGIENGGRQAGEPSGEFQRFDGRTVPPKESPNTSARAIPDVRFLTALPFSEAGGNL
jgi:hypothetical protein